MAENRNMELNEEMMAEAAGGAYYPARFKVGDIVEAKIVKFGKIIWRKGVVIGVIEEGGLWFYSVRFYMGGDTKLCMEKELSRA